MDHEKERKKEKSWMMNHIMIVMYLQKILTQAAKSIKNGKGPYFNANQIQKAIGLLKTNCVKIDGDGISMIALYPTYSLTNHNCISCNTRTSKIHTPDGVSLGGITGRYELKFKTYLHEVITKNHGGKGYHPYRKTFCTEITPCPLKNTTLGYTVHLLVTIVFPE